MLDSLHSLGIESSVHSSLLEMSVHGPESSQVAVDVRGEAVVVSSTTLAIMLVDHVKHTVYQ